ncbi:MAG TPA: ABC transporter permease [Terriglobia bacterium]|nr:ABC transporter permease [Terriglobia bacterium]
MSTLMQDLRYAFRRLRQSPGFAFVCVLTLALGIGANTAIFTLVDAVMLKSLPVTNPKQLYRLGNDNNCCVIGGFQDNWGIYSYELYKQFRDHTPEFSEMAAFQAGLQDLSARRSGAAGPAEPYVGEFVSGNYFSTFGLGAYAGRVITPADDTPGAPPVAVMSYRTWQQHYGLDPSVVGGTFTINTVPYTVAGIAPPGFFGDQLRPDPPDFWLSLSTEPALEGKEGLLNRPDSHWLYVIGRLKPGVRPASVQSEVTVELQRWLSVQPDLTAHDRSELGKQHIVVAPAGGGVRNLQRETSAGLRLLMIISGLVLLIACANIANLLLARGAATRFETAIRVALGAPRRRLIRQIITESVVLAILGGLAGLVVAFAGTRTILWLAFRGAHYIPISPTPSLAVLGFAFLLSLVTGVVFGVAPAWVTSHSDPAEALRGAGRSTRDRSSLPRKSLVVLQVALSAILLIGAGLLTQTLRNLENQRFGFETQGRLIVRVNPALAGYKPEKLYGLYQQLEQRLPQIPGVLSASYSLYSPMRGDNWSSGIHLEGHPPDERNGASWDRVGPHYFETIGTRLVRGRAIGDEDTPTSRQVAVINATFAREFFPKQDPIGKHFGLGDASHSGDFEIVGVVEDAKYQDAREPAYATFFLPLGQMTTDPKLSWLIYSHYIGDIELRVAGKPENLEAAVRRTLADIDPNLTVVDMVSLSEQLTRNFNQERLIARLTELFGVLALVLASVGLYGVTSYSVARRTSEIGIRMALGADRSSVLGLVLRGALLQLGLGLAIGIPAALAGGRLLSSQLYGVKSHDPLILGVAAVALAACALVAAFVPARRAASIDPMQALRTE